MSESRQVGSVWRMFPVLLLMAGVLQGCGGESVQVQEGAAFAPQPDPVAGGARVYLYWPAGERSAWQEVHLGLSMGMEMLRPGGYVETVVGPGWQHFEAFHHLRVSDSADAALNLADLMMEAQSNRTYYVRVGPKPGSLALGIELRPVEAEVALPEIQRCRRTVVVQPEA